MEGGTRFVKGPVDINYFILMVSNCVYVLNLGTRESDISRVRELTEYELVTSYSC